MANKTQAMSQKDAAGQLIPDNKLVISINYHDYVFPYDDGIAVINAFRKAERIENRNSDTLRRIIPIDVNLDSHPLSHQLYAEAKLLTLIEGEEEDEQRE